MASYYRRFIANFADIARPLHQLAHSDKNFQWTPAADTAFETLKQRLISSPVLAYPDFSESASPFVLDCDASNTMVGGILSQVQDGKERVIAYGSRCLQKPELNYCTTRKELLALITFVRRYRPYLLGRHFLVRTDHYSLKWLQNFTNASGQTARWQEELAAFDFEIFHRQGRLHLNADALSRRPVKDHKGCPSCDPNSSHREEPEPYANENTFNAVTTASPAGELFVPSSGSTQRSHQGNNDFSVTEIAPSTLSADNIRKSQRLDPDLNWIISHLSDHTVPCPQEFDESPHRRAFKASWPSLYLKQGTVYRSITDVTGKTHNVFVIPPSLVPTVLQAHHNNPGAGHWSFLKTENSIKTRYWWPRYNTDIWEWIRSCSTCSQCQPPYPHRRAPLIPITQDRPFQCVSMDLMGPIRSPNGDPRYILVLVDLFTKWAEAVIIPNMKAQTVAQAILDHWVCRYGTPENFHSDQGTNFMSDTMKSFCKLFGIEQTRTTPFHPQGNGAVERMNRTIQAVIRKYLEDDDSDWERQLQLAMLAYRHTVHKTTKCSPFKMVFGEDMRLPTDETIQQEVTDRHGDISQYIESLQSKLVSVRELAKSLTIKQQSTMKSQHDKISKPVMFKVGDLVWLTRTIPDPNKAPKFQRPYIGPYQITKQYSPVTFKISSISIGSRKKPQVVHANRLKHLDGQYIPKASKHATPLQKLIFTPPNISKTYEIENADAEDEEDDLGQAITRPRRLITRRAQPTSTLDPVIPEDRIETRTKNTLPGDQSTTPEIATGSLPPLQTPRCPYNLRPRRSSILQ